MRVFPHAGDDGVDGDKNAKSDGEDGLDSNEDNSGDGLG